jgi:hypothetical protein
MSFLDDIIDAGSGVLGFLGGSGIGPSLARTAITGYALNQLTKSINQGNQTTSPAVDPGVRLQIAASTENSIPVVYGTAWLGGIITDAQLTNNNGTMYYCITLSEKTGNLGLGSGAASSFTFGDIYRDDMRLVFNSDGVTLQSVVDREGNICPEMAGKIKVYCFNGNSDSPVAPQGYTNGTLQPAYNIMPTWDNTFDMSGLVFAIIRIDYDSVNNLQGLGTFKFQLKNSMTLPGDCLYDYMSNSIYGAGIPAGSIYIS